MESAVTAAHAVPPDAPAERGTSTGLNSRKLVFWTFLGSECMFFGSLISTYLVYKNKSVQGPYPQQVLNIPLTSFSTFVLLMSSLMMVLSLNAVQHDRMGRAKLWLACTAALGMTFLGGQVFEFYHFVTEKGLTLQRNLFGSTFYVLTGFHGAHVTVGVIWLLSLLTMAFMGKLSVKRSLDVEIAGLYWHFVDIVWIVIFTMVYLIQ